MPHPSRSFLALIALFVLSSASIAAIHAFWPGLRFEYGPLNYLTFAVIHISLPVVLACAAVLSIRRWVRVLLLVVTVAAGLPTVALASIATFQAITAIRAGKDPSLELLTELARDGTFHRLYRSNRNPDKAHSLLLRREEPIAFGLKRVTDLKGFYGSVEARLVVLEGGRGRVTTMPFNQYHPVQVFEFSL